MVWCGDLVWCDVVWCGVVWFGVMWCGGVVLCRLILFIVNHTIKKTLNHHRKALPEIISPTENLSKTQPPTQTLPTRRKPHKNPQNPLNPPNAMSRHRPALMWRSAKRATRTSPLTVHFCVSQLGRQEWFMKRLLLPFGPASMILEGG